MTGVETGSPAFPTGVGLFFKKTTMVDFKKKLKILKLEKAIIDFIKQKDSESTGGDYGATFFQIERATKAKPKHLKKALNKLYKDKKVRVKDVPYLDKVVFYNYDIEENE